MIQVAMADQGQASGGSETGQRRRAAAALSRLLGRLLAPAARRRGFTAVEVVEEWPRIVGADLARRCHPLRLEFRRGTTAGGTLVLQAGGGAALELQHMAPQLIERVNDYFGFRAAARLQIIQMPPRPAPPRPAPPAHRPLTAEEEEALAAAIAPINDAGLGDALRSLGRSIKARRPRA